MKTIRYKPYSPISHIPASLKRTVKYSVLELQPLCELLFQEIRRLELQVDHFQKIIDMQTVEIERLEGINRGQRDALFGVSTEKLAKQDFSAEVLQPIASNSVTASSQWNPRGGRYGHKGYGRKIPDLPEIQ